MKKILISLREQPYKDIIFGNKKFEYRKKWIKEECEAYVYVSGKIKEILLKIKFGAPICKSKKEIAKIAEKENPDWYKSTLDYFGKNNMGNAIPILEIKVLEKNKNLIWMRENNLPAPQGYIFLDENTCKKIES